jgi:hypothetical protein
MHLNSFHHQDKTKIELRFFHIGPNSLQVINLVPQVPAHVFSPAAFMVSVLFLFLIIIVTIVLTFTSLLNPFGICLRKFRGNK